MSEGVIADLVTFGNLALKQIGVQFAVQSDHKKRRRRVCLLQLVEDLRCVFGIGAVVKGQRDLVSCGAVASDHPGGRKLGNRLGRDEAADRVELYFACALPGFGRYAQHLAGWIASRRRLRAPTVLIAEPIPVGHSHQLRSRLCVERDISTKEGPKRGVFASEPPQCYSASTERPAHRYLVESRYRIEHPNLMALLFAVVLFDPFELRVERRRIEFNSYPVGFV